MITIPPTNISPKVHFQTAGQDTRISHAFDRSAFPPSQSMARVESGLNEVLQRLNEAELSLSDNKVSAPEVSP